MPTFHRRILHSDAARSLTGYLALFAILTHAWWTSAADSVPGGNDPRDSRLIIWILGWVARALVTDPTGLFDPPIFFPARGLLAGSEHLLGAQLVFAPAYWTTGNAVLAANVVALLSFPASAFAMERLLAAQKLDRGAAWIGGLVFSLGVLRVPASLQVVQYLTAFMPLVALRLQRLRDRARAREAALLTVCVAVGFFSSYYLFVLIVLSAGLWGVLQLFRQDHGRGRFIALAAGSMLLSAMALASVSGSYLDRARQPGGRVTGTAPGIGSVSRGRDPERVPPPSFFIAAGRVDLASDVRDPVWLVFAALAVGGVAVNLRPRASRRALVVTGTSAILLGAALFVFGWPPLLARWLGFFRTRTRFLLLSSFGFSLLVAIGFDALLARLSSRTRAAALVVVLTSFVVAIRIEDVVPRRDPILAASRDREIYRALREIVREEGPGTLLEIPYVSNFESDTGAEALIGQLEHGMPLATGFTGYRPAHHSLIASWVSRLPAEPALDDLVDSTHLRWILIRPAEDWHDPQARQAFLDGLHLYPALGPARTIDSWVLQRVDRVPAHREWFESIAAGPRPGQSLLGTSLAPIPENEALAEISAGVAPEAIASSWAVSVFVSARNLGTAGWPTSRPDSWNGEGLVHFLVRWRRLGDDGEGEEPAAVYPISRDVPPLESMWQSIIVRTPDQPGAYELSIGIEQDSGATFSAPGNSAATLRLAVVPKEELTSGELCPAPSFDPGR